MYSHNPETQMCYTMYLHKHSFLHYVLTQTQIFYTMYLHKHRFVTLCTQTIYKHRNVTLCTHTIHKHKFVTIQPVYSHDSQKNLLIQSYYHVSIGELHTYRGFHDKSFEDKGNI